MASIALVFSGQGAQYPGMGSSLYQNCASAKETLDSLNTIRPETKEQLFSASAEQLKDTRNTQPCILAVSLMAGSALCEKGIIPKAVAGFSLGELSALAFAKVFTQSAAMKLAVCRGQIMAEAASEVKTCMCAVMKLPSEKVESLASEFSNIYPVNFNSPKQVVVAGEEQSMLLFADAVKEAGGRVVPLKVSGAFHSPYMEAASELFEKQLQSFHVSPPVIPVYSCMTATTYSSDSAEIRKQFAAQMKSPVLWQKTIENMMDNGIDTFIECGPGKTLKGLIEQCTDKLTVLNVEDTDSLNATIEHLGK